MKLRPPSITWNSPAVDVWWGHASSRGQRFAAIVTSLLALTLLCAALIRWQRAETALQDALADIEFKSALLAPPPRSPAPTPVQRSASDLSRHNAAVSQLNLPWSDVFDGLERHVQTGIALTLLEPDATSGTLRVQAEARGVDELLTYAEVLSLDPSFSELVVRRHETNETDPNRPARLAFDLRLGRVPAAARP